jgi:hypothetical protein
MKIAIQEYNLLPKYLIYWTKLPYTYISFDLNNGWFIVVKFLFWNCHIKALDKGDLVLIIFVPNIQKGEVNYHFYFFIPNMDTNWHQKEPSRALKLQIFGAEIWNWARNEKWYQPQWDEAQWPMGSHHAERLVDPNLMFSVCTCSGVSEISNQIFLHAQVPQHDVWPMAWLV